MRNKPRYVFDANVVVSAVLFHERKPAQAIDAALDEGEILVSDEIVKTLAADADGHCGGRDARDICM